MTKIYFLCTIKSYIKKLNIWRGNMNKLLMNMSRLLSTYTEGQVKDLKGVSDMLSGIFKQILGPVLTVIGVIAVGYAIYLGILYAKAEDAQKRKDVQGRLIGAIIGVVIAIVGATLCFALDWTSIFNSFAGITK